MRIIPFFAIKDSLRPLAGADRSWIIAYGATLLIPWALVASRAAADALAIAVGLLFLWHSASRRNWKWLSDSLIHIMFAAWAWMVLVVSPFAVDPASSLAVALAWVRFPLLYAALTSWVLKREEALWFLAMTLAALLALVAVDTLWQYMYGISLSGNPINESGRLSGPLPNVKVGLFMARLLPFAAGIALYAALTNRRLTSVAASLSLLTVCVVTLMLSGERTPFLMSMAAVILAAGLLAITELRFRRDSLLVAGGLLAISALLWATQGWVQTRADYLYENLSGFPASSYGQLVWVGYELGKEHWLTGTGLKGFRVLCPDFLNAGAVNHCNLHPHNPYVEWFAETGLPGVLLFSAFSMGLLFVALRAFFRRQDAGRLLPAVALGAWMLNLFPLMPTQSFFSNWPGILFWYSLGTGFAALNWRNGSVAAPPAPAGG